MAGVPLAASVEARRSLTPEITSCAHLADKVRRDAEFMEVDGLYRGRPDFDLTELVVERVASESVPFLPVLRYKDSGLRKRAIWEQVWDLQRREEKRSNRPKSNGARNRKWATFQCHPSTTRKIS
jgi:hypothetical protein